MRGGPYTFLLVALSIVLSVTPWGRASAQVSVPTGTQVALKFSAALDSGTVKEGDTVLFTVASDVIVDRTIIIKQGTRRKAWWFRLRNLASSDEMPACKSISSRLPASTGVPSCLVRSASRPRPYARPGILVEPSVPAWPASSSLAPSA